MHFSAKLEELGACLPAVRWAETMPDVRTAYAKCPNGHWLWWLLSDSGVDYWPDEGHERFDKEYVKIRDPYCERVKPLRDEYWDKRRGLQSKFKDSGQLDHEEYCEELRRLDSECALARKGLDDQYHLQIADLIRSIVPVEVFLKIFEES